MAIGANALSLTILVFYHSAISIVSIQLIFWNRFDQLVLTIVLGTLSLIVKIPNKL